MSEDKYERDLARRLHAASIARGKAEAALERVPRDIPAAFRMKALADVALAYVAWLKIYFEAIEHFQRVKDRADENGADQ